jgi:AcrR family transcriptional regulator
METMSTRVYASPAREAAAAQKKARVVAAATALLRSQGSVTAVSLDAVARAAGVTRLTVYNQFGSRKGLLEAVLDQVASDAGMHRIGDLMANADPHDALQRLIDLVCHAWAFDDSMARLHAAAQIDPEFADAVSKRIERRRAALRVLVNRMSAHEPMGDAAKSDLVDLLFALTSFEVFEALRAGRRTPQRVAKLMKQACAATLADTFGKQQARGRHRS